MAHQPINMPADRNRLIRAACEEETCQCISVGGLASRIGMLEERSMSDLHNRFNYHPPRSEARRNAHDTVRQTLLETAETLAAIVPPGREHAIVLTKLEEAMFWANAGLARTPDTEAPDAA